MRWLAIPIVVGSMACCVSSSRGQDLLRPETFKLGQQGVLAPPDRNTQYQVAEVLSDKDVVVTCVVTVGRLMLDPSYFVVQTKSTSRLRKGQIYYTKNRLEVFETRKVKCGLANEPRTLYVLRKVDSKNPPVAKAEEPHWISPKFLELNQKGVLSPPQKREGYDFWYEVNEVLSDTEILVKTRCECFNPPESTYFVLQMPSTKGLVDGKRVYPEETLEVFDTRKIGRMTVFVLRPAEKK